MKKMLFSKLVVGVLCFCLIFSNGVIPNSYAGDAPITYINFANCSYQHPNGSNLYYTFHIESSYPSYWTFTAPPGSYIHYVSYGNSGYTNSNEFRFEIDGVLYYSHTNNKYSTFNTIPGQTVTNLNATTVEFSRGDIYLGGLIIGLKYAIPDESLVISARNAANKAASNAENAKASADAAKKAAEQARDAVNAAQADTTYIRNTQLPNLQQALENKIANIETVINNNINKDTMSPIVKIQTVSGARATSASSIPCIITVTDNSAGPFEYRVNNGPWIALPFDGRVSLPVTQPGMNTITVEVKDPSGNIGREAINIRKL